MKVELHQVSVRYGSREVVRGLNLQLQPGSVLGLVGPNGSGKSTLVKAIAGLVPYAGLVHFNGSAIRPKSIGYMPQDLQSPAALTVLEVVLLGRLGHLRLQVTPQDLQAVRHVLSALGVESLAAQYIGELSGGQRQMVFLAQALVSEPDVLLLDEPISALDVCHQLEVLQLVRTITRQRHLSTLVVLHDLNAAARFADDVALLRAGELMACGSPLAVLTRPTIGQAFGVALEVLRCSDATPVLVPTASLRKIHEVS